jgi:DNA-binding response OmpR family regulator
MGLRVAPPCHHVLVIEDGDEVAPQRVYNVVAQDPALRSRHVTWSALARSGETCDANLIVAVIAGAHTRIAPLLEAIERDNLLTPVVAVIPEGDEAIMSVAARLADDFLFSPIRPLELRHRVARLLSGPRADARGIADRLVEEI